MSAKPARRSIAIVVPPNAQSLDVSGPLDAFLEANRQSSGRVHYDVRLVAIDAGRTIRAGGMSLIADSSIFDDSKAIDTLLVAGTPPGSQGRAGPDLCRRWLTLYGRRSHSRDRSCFKVDRGRSRSGSRVDGRSSAGGVSQAPRRSITVQCAPRGANRKRGTDSVRATLDP